jgi:CrcB protein
MQLVVFGPPHAWPDEIALNRDAGYVLRANRADVSFAMSGLISVILGSALGGVARYFISGVVARRVGETFPWGTLMINVSGAFLIGTFGGLSEDAASIFASTDTLPDPWLFAVTGFLGCYTTVSSFSLQTLSLARDGQTNSAAGYVALSVCLCLAAAGLGFALVDLLR